MCGPHCLQELLDHTFLHPNRVTQPAPAAGPVLSEEQMKLLVAQVQAAGAAGVTDLDKLTRELMQRLGATTLNSSSSSAASDSGASGASSPRASTAGLQSTAAASAAAAPKQQQPEQQRSQSAAGQQRQTTGGLSGSSKSRIPTAVPSGHPGWR